MSEADTREEVINEQLKAAGWVSGGDVLVEREYYINKGKILANGKRAKKLKADYILSYRNTKIAVVEAKSSNLNVSVGVGQAKLYAKMLKLDTSFSANGREIYQICHKTGKERIVANFPTPQELWDKTFGEANEWSKKFSEVPFENMGGTKKPHYYQEVAVNQAMHAIANSKKRLLLTLATGTGKTFIAFQIAWKLYQTRWNKQGDGKRRPRILFLADRNFLADQARTAFSKFGDDALVRIKPDEISKSGEVPKNGNVFFTIFQTFMSGDDNQGEKYYQAYERDFFDLIIIDECHRGGANDESTWRDILNHFDSAVHIGLTATPKRDANANTYDYFGEPIYTYSLKNGINDGFLTPFKVKRIQSNIDNYHYTPDDELLEGEIKKGHVYVEAEFNRKIEIEARERNRVREMLANINEDEKTIIFCASQEHAALIRDLINQESPSTNVDYCARVTSDEGDIGDNHLRLFQDNEKSIPTILTTSQKLTTGVDVLNIRNIVLLRPIDSMITFKQIIGRGTRTFEGKDYFTILDFVGAYHKFSDPDWDGEAIEIDNDDENDNKDNDKKPRQTNQDKQPEAIIKIQLSDEKIRNIKNMTDTFFYIDGTPVDAKTYLKYLFYDMKLPEILGDEKHLRKLWAKPTMRRELLKELEKAHCKKEDLEKLQELTEVENSDLFDVLSYIAYAKPMVNRETRVNASKDNIYNFIKPEQKEFIDYVLKNYIKEGIDELDTEKFSNALIAKYGSIPDAKQKLGDLKTIKEVFAQFQQHLYADNEAVG